MTMTLTSIHTSSANQISVRFRGWLGLALSCSLLFACGGQAIESEETAAAPKTEQKASASSDMVQLTGQQYQYAGIQLGKLETRRLGRVVKVNGVLDVPPQNMASVSAPMGGFLKSTRLLPGTRVKKGQVIAMMEHPDYIQLQQDYLDSKSRLELAQLEYDRQKELNRENVNSAKVYQQATADYQVLQHRVKALSEKLLFIGLNPTRLSSEGLSRAIPIYSPINGYVKEVNVNLGRFVNPTDVLFEIINTEHMHLALSVFEKDVSRIREEQRVVFNLPNEPRQERMGRVHLVGKAIGTDKTVMIHVHIDKDDPTLLPGMYVNARIETGDSTALTVPDAAIVSAEGKDYVFVPKGGQPHGFQRVEITKGISENGYTAVRLPANLKPEQTRVVVKGAYSLLAKMLNVEEE